MTTTVVKALSEKVVNTKRGPAKTYSFCGDDETWYKLGFKPAPFAKGDTIEFEATSGAYGMEVDFPSIRVINKGDGSSAPSGGGGRGAPSRGAFPIAPNDGQRSIIRQNAVTNARELLGLYFISSGEPGKRFATVDEALDEVIRIAQKIELYTTGDKERIIKEMSGD